jgi:hypothetical protein
VHGIALADQEPAAAIAELRRAFALEPDPQYLYAACEIAVRSADGSARECLEALRPHVPPQLIAPLEAALPR